MRCTTAYRAFLEKLGTAHLMRWQKRLRVPVFDASGRRSVLRADALPWGLHLGLSFAAYGHLSLADKLRVARGILAIQRGRTAVADSDISFGEWLRAHGQNETAIARFWDLIVVPALNCRCDDASAAQALFVFREGFLKSPESAAIGVPSVGLSALHVEPAVRYIEARGGEVRVGAALAAFEVSERDAGAAVDGIVLGSGERLSFDAYVAALPPRQLLDTLPSDDRRSRAVRRAARDAHVAHRQPAPLVRWANRGLRVRRVHGLRSAVGISTILGCLVSACLLHRDGPPSPLVGEGARG